MPSKVWLAISMPGNAIQPRPNGSLKRLSAEARSAATSGSTSACGISANREDMATAMAPATARYAIGQVLRHRRDERLTGPLNEDHEFGDHC